VACDSFYWHGINYTTAGTQLATMTNAAGCDSVVTLNLTVNHSSVGDTTVTACNSFSWWNTVHMNSTDDATHTFFGENAAGCDSTVTLHLTVNYSSVVDTFAVACDSFAWRGTTYMESGDVTWPQNGVTSLNSVGCDSIVMLHLTVNHSSSGDTTVYACDGFNWHGTELSSSGDYLWPQDGTISLNANGCDSLTTLHLTIGHTSYGDTNAAACDSIVWYGNKYTVPGEYSQILTSALPTHCDSILTLHLEVNHSVITEIADSFCTGSTYYFAGDYLVASGIYDNVRISVLGCDSTVRLHLTMLAKPIVSIDTSLNCREGLYFLRANTDVDYIHWSSNYNWPAEWGSDLSRNLTVHINRPTVFTLFVDYYSDHTCPNITSITLSPLVLPTASMQVTPEFLTSGNLTFNAVSHSRNAEWLRWFIDGDEVSNNERITYTADSRVDSVIVTLEAMTYPCTDTAQKTIYVRRSTIFAPNVFTPDEATNRTFNIVCNGVIEYELDIFTRQGLHVYHTIMGGEPWDGTKDGRGCPQESYVWIVKYRSEADPQNWHVEKGTVTILR
ncbi:MAG: gliding motility-associated C-terminal domain-containing protein, partial [Bacteroidales bacterium]|nr:gliding motility-associated C-terminal domain-containing protein [Bacteroidales bacterium]